MAAELANLRQRAGGQLGVGLQQRPRFAYRGTSLIRKRLPLGPYCRTMPRALWWSWGGRLFLIAQLGDAVSPPPKPVVIQPDFPGQPAVWVVRKLCSALTRLPPPSQHVKVNMLACESFGCTHRSLSLPLSAPPPLPLSLSLSLPPSLSPSLSALSRSPPPSPSLSLVARQGEHARVRELRLHTQVAPRNPTTTCTETCLKIQIGTAR